MKELYTRIENIDEKLLKLARKIAIPFAHFALFVVYFWFGAVKVFSISPANPLIVKLLVVVLPGMPFASFIVAFGVVEMIIGVLFIIPRLERLAVFVVILHLITTIAPLFVLPEIAWQSSFTPTLEGQYILKNILIISITIFIMGHLKPLKEKRLSKNV